MGGGFRLDNHQRSSDMPPKRKCKFNDDWRRDFAWIAKLPNNCMEQCNLCVTDFSISSGGRTDVRRYQESACHDESNEDIRAHIVVDQDEQLGLHSTVRVGIRAKRSSASCVWQSVPHSNIILNTCSAAK